MRRICAMILLLMVTGCAISQDEIARADFGSFPSDYAVRIKAYYEATLFDPYSAHYDTGTPYKAAVHRDWIHGGGWIYGYAVDTSVNAKNRYGAYVGRKSEILFLPVKGDVSQVIFADDKAFFQKIPE